MTRDLPSAPDPVPTSTSKPTTGPTQAAATSVTSATDADRTAGRPRRAARTGLLAVVFVCAACGLVYELALVALGSFLIGNTATQASIVLSVMVCSMGIGALLAKPLQRRAALSFAVVELLLALLGGLSVLMLYAAFAWLQIYTLALVAVAAALGILIGAEIPLLMTLLQRIRKQSAGSAVADLFAADYIGALLGGLAFPFVLLPIFGQIQGALVVGLVNVAAGIALVFTVFRKSLRFAERVSVVAGALVVVGVLVFAFVTADRFEVTARQALYRDPVVLAEQTPYQDIVMTQRSVGGRDDLRLFLNGDLQFSSADEYRYHESLVHPAMAGRHGKVLVLGGGDGLALREVLRYPDVASATLVELDPAMIELGRTDPRLTALNDGSMNDPRATVLAADAFNWLRETPADAAGSFDVILIDMPDPDETATAKLYSVEFYALAKAHLKPGGRIAIQAGSPYFAPRSYWCIDAGVREAGLVSTPYHVDVPSFGNWGFLLAAPDSAPDLRLRAPAPLRFLSDDELRAAAVFPADRPPLQIPASTLMRPRILDIARSEWTQY